MEYKKAFPISYPVNQFQPEWLLSTIESYMKNKLQDYPEGSDLEVTIPLVSILEYIIMQKGFSKIDESDIYEHMLNGHKSIAFVFKQVSSYKELFAILLDEIVRLACQGDLIIFINVPVELDKNTESNEGLEDDAIIGVDYKLTCINTPDRLSNTEELTSILYSLLTPSNVGYIEISYNKVS